MPIYEYRCERGHTFEVLQRMTDDPVVSCTACDATVQRVLHPVAVHFKGSGFYTTDYGRRGGGSADSAETKSNGSGPSEGGSKGEKPAKTGKDKGSKPGSTSSSSG